MQQSLARRLGLPGRGKRGRHDRAWSMPACGPCHQVTAVTLAGESARWEVAMGLPVGQRKDLDMIEIMLRASDPGLTSLFTIFTRLNQDEEMPGREQLKAGAARLCPWLRTRPPSAGPQPPAIPGPPLSTPLFLHPPQPSRPHP